MNYVYWQTFTKRKKYSNKIEYHWFSFVRKKCKKIEINERNKKKLCNKQEELYKPKISKLYDFQTIKLPIGWLQRLRVPHRLKQLKYDLNMTDKFLN